MGVFLISAMLFAVLTLAPQRGLAADHEVHGCYHKSTGILRIVPDADRCRSWENHVAFGKSGERGPAGAPESPVRRGHPVLKDLWGQPDHPDQWDLPDPPGCPVP